jgi:hypothetical protein
MLAGLPAEYELNLTTIYVITTIVTTTFDAWGNKGVFYQQLFCVSWELDG